MGSAGEAFWQLTVSEYGLTPGELSTLEEVCRTKEECLRLESVLSNLSDLVVPGSTGQPKMHPILEELRRHRALLDKLTAALALPPVNQGTDDSEPVACSTGSAGALGPR